MSQPTLAPPADRPEVEPRPFRCRFSPTPMGAVFEHERQVRLDALLVGGGLMTPRSLTMQSLAESRWREVVAGLSDEGLPSALEVTVLAAVSNDPFVRGSALLPEPLMGRRVRVEAPSRVTPLDGSALAPDEASRVLRQSRRLMTPPLYWTFGPRAEVFPNTPLSLDKHVAASWFGHDDRFEVESATATCVGVAALENTPVGVFEVTVVFTGASPEMKLQARLAGWVAVDEASGERVATSLAGPVELAVTARAVSMTHPMSGQGRLVIATRTRLGEDGGA